MKIEFTRAEIEAIILAHANALAPDAKFNDVEPTGYRSMPDGFVVSTKPKQEPAYAAQ
jgi:hypothetical protein